MSTDLDVLRRAHALFAGQPAHPALAAALDALTGSGSIGTMADAYRNVADDRHSQQVAAGRVDARFLGVLAAAQADHHAAHLNTAAVLTAARADAVTSPDSPIAARELLRRRAMRLRTQHSHVRAARARGRRHRSALRSLRYRSHHTVGRRSKADGAVRAAMSRLGRPYVWGATGPDRFDCSGLVQWAYAQAGVHLRRTTYEQIHDGVPVTRAQVRPGDLVFPHAGHVQMAIGNGLVVEAPQPGATVQISRMGGAVAIRRPV